MLSFTSSDDRFLHALLLNLADVLAFSELKTKSKMQKADVAGRPACDKSNVTELAVPERSAAPDLRIFE